MAKHKMPAPLQRLDAELRFAQLLEDARACGLEYATPAALTRIFPKRGKDSFRIRGREGKFGDGLTIDHGKFSVAYRLDAVKASNHTGGVLDAAALATMRVHAQPMIVRGGTPDDDFYFTPVCILHIRPLVRPAIYHQPAIHKRKKTPRGPHDKTSKTATGAKRKARSSE